MPWDQRSVREQFNKLFKDYKNKKNKEEQASGINPDPPTENEVMLEEIAEAMESTPLCVENANSKKDDKKWKEALACRDKAMTTWAKAGASGDVSDSEHESNTEKNTVKRRGRKRRASSDPFQYLAERTAKETDLRKEELELQRQQMQLKAEQQKEQFKLQQEQMKQMMQSQMNTQNLIFAQVQKIGTK